MTSEIAVRTVGPLTIWDLPAGVTPTELRQAIGSLGEQPALAVNLQAVGWVDSGGLGALVDLFRRVKALGGNVVYYGLQPTVSRLVQVTRLNQILTIDPGESEALRRLQGDPE